MAAAGIAKLFQRQLKEEVDKKDSTISILPSPREHVYIRDCMNCTFTVASPSMKCTIESCVSVNVVFEDKICSGILEILTSNDVTITTAINTKVPTITVDRSSNVHLHLHEPTTVGIIHSVGVDNVYIHFDKPYMLEQKLNHPLNEDGEFLTRISLGKLHTEKCIREGGGYLTTVREKEAADKKVALFEEKMSNMISDMISGKSKTPPSKAAPPTSKAPSTAGKEPTPPKNKPIQQDKESSLIDALQKGKAGLKPTETVERQVPVVGVSGGSGKGKGRQYNIADDEEKKEHFDDEIALNKKVKKVTEWIRNSKHTIMFTGAGISTSAGIPDFRSGMNTVLPTGPGVWEIRAEGTRRGNAKITPILQAMPTPTHMAIVKLHESGYCKFTVSQNVDGLHRRSGLPYNELAELHGNTNLEICKKCNREYLRDFETREAAHVFDHKTSRKCDDPNCQGQLHDSIINFGENLPEKELKKAFDNAQKADVCIVLGSSLRVRPACQVPEVVLANGGNVVICNLQKIPQFPPTSRTLPVFAMCDVFMKQLMHELQMDIPKFLLKRRIKITSETKGDKTEVSLSGIDADEDIPYSFIIGATLEGSKEKMIKDPFTFTVPSDSGRVRLILEFQGHYGEPPLTVEYNPAADNTSIYWLDYDVIEGVWHQMSKNNQ